MSKVIFPLRVLRPDEPCCIRPGILDATGRAIATLPGGNIWLWADGEAEDLVKAANGYDAAQTRIYELEAERDALKAALTNLLYWVDDNHTIGLHSGMSRNLAIQQAKAALPPAPEAEQVKCLHVTHIGWHDKRKDCVQPLTRNEFAAPPAPEGAV